MGIPALLVPLGAVSVLLPATAPSDPRAVEIARSMIEAMGGSEAFKTAPYLQFGFHEVAGGRYLARRHYLWDRSTGRYRVESRPVNGEVEIALMNTITGQGRAARAGQELTGSAAAEATARGQRDFESDRFWLMMPWHWLDAGVNLRHAGTSTHRGSICEMVEVSSLAGGPARSGVYRAYVSRKTHLMVHWISETEAGGKAAWDWEYGETAGLRFPRRHTSRDGAWIDRGVMAVAKVLVDESIFTDWSRTLVGKR